jgi:hypothetical protein
MLLLLVLACAGNIAEMYEAEKATALAPPSAPGEAWTPELRLRLSEASLARAAEEVVAAGALSVDKAYGVDNPLGIPLKARPSAKVTRLDVTVGQDCRGCLVLDGTLEGKVRWAAGPAKGTVPFTARLSGDMRFSTEAQGDGWRVTGRVVELGRVKVQAGKVKAIDLTPIVRGWIDDALDEAPPLQLGRLGGEALPLRALRVREADGALEIQALGDVSGGKPIPAAADALGADWDLRMHPDTALALMRRTAFEAGPGEMDVAIDPRALSVSGDTFTLGLRLWRLKGAGWWRDYTVDGTLTAKNGKLKLRGEEATEGEKSRGAGLADPLALLAEGRILDAVGRGVTQSLPARRELAVKGVSLSAVADQARGEDGALLVSGTLDVGKAATDKRTPKKKKKKKKSEQG